MRILEHWLVSRIRTGGFGWLKLFSAAVCYGGNKDVMTVSRTVLRPVEN